jgi:hypothetical protein
MRILPIVLIGLCRRRRGGSRISFDLPSEAIAIFKILCPAYQGATEE